MTDLSKRLDESFDTEPYPTHLVRKDGSFNYEFTADSGEVYRVQFYPSNGLGTNVRRVYLGHKKGSIFKDVMTKFQDPMRIISTMLASFAEFQATPLGKATDGFVIDATAKAFGPTIRLLKRLAARNPAIRAKFNILDTTYTWDTARSPIWIYRKGTDPMEVFNGKNVDTPMLVDSKAKPTQPRISPVAPTAPAPAPSPTAAPTSAPANTLGHVELTSPIGNLVVLPEGKGVKIVKVSSGTTIAVADNAGSAEKIIDALFNVIDLGSGVISYGNKVLWSKTKDNYYQIIAGIGTYRVLMNGRVDIGERESVGSAIAMIRKIMGVDSQEQKTLRQLRTILMKTDDSLIVTAKVGARTIVGSPDEVRHTLSDMNDQDALGRIVSTRLAPAPKPTIKASVPKTAAVAPKAAPPVAGPVPNVAPKPTPLESLTTLQAKWKERYDGVNYGQIYIQVNGVYNDNQFSVSWDITERRTTPREIYTQNKYDIGSANSVITQLEGIARTMGFDTQAAYCTFDTIVDDERRIESNGDSLYSEYEQSIGGHLDVKL